jgi:hypothetical protein
LQGKYGGYRGTWGKPVNASTPRKNMEHARITNM